MELRPPAAPIEGRPSLRPLVFVLAVLLAAWLAALALIVAELV